MPRFESYDSFQIQNIGNSRKRLSAMGRASAETGSRRDATQRDAKRRFIMRRTPAVARLKRYDGDMADEPKKQNDDEVWRSLAGAGESVLSIGLLSGLGAWGGSMLDSHFHSTPWCAIVLSLMGLSLGLARMVMKALQSEKK